MEEKQRRWPRRLKLRQLVQIIGRPTRATDRTSSWESWRDTSTDTTDKSTDIGANDWLVNQTERQTHTMEKLGYQTVEVEEILSGRDAIYLIFFGQLCFRSWKSLSKDIKYKC